MSKVTVTADPEDAYADATALLSLLIRCAQAEQTADRGGTSPDLDHSAARGMEMVLEDIQSRFAALADSYYAAIKQNQAAKTGTR